MTSQVRVELSPALMESGLELKANMRGALDSDTVTIADAVALPALLEAVNVYVVVELGITLLVPVEETVPISGLMETDVAPATFHDNVAD